MRLARRLLLAALLAAPLTAPTVAAAHSGGDGVLTHRDTRAELSEIHLAATAAAPRPRGGRGRPPPPRPAPRALRAPPRAPRRCRGDPERAPLCLVRRRADHRRRRAFVAAGRLPALQGRLRAPRRPARPLRR